jgi:hypothetical protein
MIAGSGSRRARFSSACHETMATGNVISMARRKFSVPVIAAPVAKSAICTGQA